LTGTVSALALNVKAGAAIGTPDVLITGVIVEAGEVPSTLTAETVNV
jgi:hypothetical protein